MHTDFILKQVLGMTSASLSARAQQYYKAEKMLMRQFILMKQRHLVPYYLSVKDMKAWLLAGQSFQKELQETAKGVEVRKLLIAELAWVSARQRCLTQIEQELQEEFQEEKRLTKLFRREVTLEGLQMFLSVFRPKAEQDVRTFLRHLSNKLLSSFTGSHTSKRSKLMLLIKLQLTTTALAPQVVNTALKFLFLDDSLVEVKPSHAQVMKKSSSLTSSRKSRAEAAAAHIGKLLADEAITCFCLVTSFTRARFLRVCTPVAFNMVKAIYKRFLIRSKSFHLMDFDESLITAREGIISALHDMENRAQRAACSWTLNQLPTENEAMTSEPCSLVTAEWTDEKTDEEGKQQVQDFFRRFWKKLTSKEE